jgi:hypothetical protein
MQLRIPSDAPVGPATLVWALGDGGAADKEDFQIETP